jgi:hypothetical protein
MWLPQDNHPAIRYRVTVRQRLEFSRPSRKTTSRISKGPERRVIQAKLGFDAVTVQLAAAYRERGRVLSLELDAIPNRPEYGEQSSE